MASKAPPLTISRMEIHRRTGISMAHVSKVYGGTRKPSLGALQLIAACQNLTLEDALAQIRDCARRAKAEKKARRAA